MTLTRTLVAAAILLLLAHPSRAESPPPIFATGFDSATSNTADSGEWEVLVHSGAKAEIALDRGAGRAGSDALRLSNRSGFAPHVWAGARLHERVPVEPGTTYTLSYWASGTDARRCYSNVTFLPGGGESRYALPEGSFPWTRFTHTFVVPEGMNEVAIIFAVDDVTASRRIDDVAVRVAPRQRSNIRANWTPRPYPTAMPRSDAPPAPRLDVLDLRGLGVAEQMAASTLQGLVNRVRPRIYLISRDTDSTWLRWIVERGYTGEPRHIPSLDQLYRRYAGEIEGAIVYDEALPASANAACMIGSVRNAIATSPQVAQRLGAHIVEDLRGRWERSVDAYREVWRDHRGELASHLLCAKYPLAPSQASRDYLVQHRVFTFFTTSLRDDDPGGDAVAEEEFLHEILAETPPNIPVLGWFTLGDDKGIPEYTAVRICSAYGKYLAGTEFSSNLSVLSGIDVDPDVFRQHQLHGRAPRQVEPDRLYIALSILDSGDNQWYWQHFQRNVWDDPERGAVPIGWSLNPTGLDTMAPVLEWYYRNATPNDAFFVALSGMGYMNTAVFGSAFTEDDRERAWREHLADVRVYMHRLDLTMMQAYTGAWSERTPPSPDLFPTLFRALPRLEGVLSDFGRHTDADPNDAITVVNGKPAFHTLMRFLEWSHSDQIASRGLELEIDHAFNEAIEFAPDHRPAVMSGMVVSWRMWPGPIRTMVERLPDEYVPVLATELPSLWRQIHDRDSAGAGDRP